LVLVATAEPQRVEQICEFVSSLQQLGLRPGALVINRITPGVPDPKDIQRARLSTDLKRKLLMNLRNFSALKERESKWLETLKKQTPLGLPTLIAEDFGCEPDSLSDLARIARTIRRVD
jgi:hypothetical protein